LGYAGWDFKGRVIFSHHNPGRLRKPGGAEKELGFGLCQAGAADNNERRICLEYFTR
jgi:hypothetical protein